ncbi:hypothetical protein OHC33_008873 [Knufia fluminis]|uniref:ATP-dependent DNA ligase family profile domain-containing protein n=1 Tax=Knufia fluminis TaxID=191047 RepID=A0AAN8EQS8_9EURO|nr:hypothetical protein OHC33_008873 [Knufia fluminis]
MPFKFCQLCELLDELQRQKYQQRATYSKQDDPSHRTVAAWYNKYNDEISRAGPSAVAFLSALLPERRPDRTYNLQPKRLSQIFGRVLGVGASRLRLLQSWEEPGGPDFPTCVERVMAESEFPHPTATNEVTLEEIDNALTQIAANTLSSSPAIKAQANGKAPCDILAPIIRRLQGTEAKWLARMILKSYSSVEIPEYAALYGFHFMLPKLLAMQNSFEAVVETLARPTIASLPPRPSRDYQAALMPIVVKEITPQLGVMIRRQPFDKARSIKHCTKTASSRTMSVERKYDGEYCQIHIDISKGPNCIQIFSKSGKDSTQDRLVLHSAINAGLKLGRPECKIKERAILEGELLVYSMVHRTILPFYHVRKHVRHGGRRIGTEADSPKKSGEHAMIAFFDVLMLDDKLMINESHSNRRAHLKALVTRIEGTSQLVERQIIDFKSSRASEMLREVFGVAIRRRWEGFVLKGLDDPYFSWKEGMRGIKLKKDYIAGLGDTADLCIVGGRRDPRDEISLQSGRLSWTSFYVACLLNKEEVRRFDARPSFKIVDCLGIGSLSKQDIVALNTEGKLVEQNFASDTQFMTISHPRKDLPLPSEVFTKPMVVEIMGAGYERPQTVDYYTLRFPRRVGAKIKLHRDRDVADTVSFDELQDMAQKSLKEDAENASQEDAEWIERLLAADPASKYVVNKSQGTSPAKTLHSATTASLTPAGARRASTQQSPLLVRIDSDELTPDEFQHRYPSSAPQTPSRRSHSTVSPLSTARSASVIKRKSDTSEESPMTSPTRKKKRVGFRAIIDVCGPEPDRALSDITGTHLNTRGALPPRTVIKKSDKTATQTIRPPRQQELNFTNAPTVGNIPAAAQLPTPPSTAEAAEKGVQVAETPALHERRSESTGIQTHASAAFSAVAGFSERAAAQSVPPAPKFQVGGPIYITPSLAKHEHLLRYLQATEFDFTFSSKSFIRTLSSSSPQQQHIMLIDSSKLAEATSDIQRLSRLFHASKHSKTVGAAGPKPNILIFDLHILGTEFGKSGFEIHDSTMFEGCEKYFCGVLEPFGRSDIGRRRGLRPRWDLRLSEALLT